MEVTYPSGFVKWFPFLPGAIALAQKEDEKQSI